MELEIKKWLQDPAEAGRETGECKARWTSLRATEVGNQGLGAACSSQEDQG